ncbi:unnamed protein product, partial [Prorocentrum cordatum]
AGQTDLDIATAAKYPAAGPRGRPQGCTARGDVVLNSAIADFASVSWLGDTPRPRTPSFPIVLISGCRDGPDADCGCTFMHIDWASVTGLTERLVALTFGCCDGADADHGCALLNFDWAYVADQLTDDEPGELAGDLPPLLKVCAISFAVLSRARLITILESPGAASAG